MVESDLQQKQARFQQALNLFVERLEQDRCVLAAVMVGSLDEELIWRKETIHLWIIETDGVTRRLRSDGKDERIFRSLVEEGININAELIPRTRFKQMVEGSSRTAFSCNFFARRELVYCEDPSIQQWFEQANEVASKDQKRELLATSSWTIHALRHARKLVEWKGDLELATQTILWAAHSIAALEIIKLGEIVEDEAIYRGVEAEPELFQVIYLDVLAKKRTKKRLVAALDQIEAYLDQHWPGLLEPLLHYLKKQQRVVPLSEISEHFAFTQLYPWHLESACEWLERKGQLEKVSTPFKLTNKSRVPVEEPAYYLPDR